MIRRRPSGDLAGPPRGASASGRYDAMGLVSFGAGRRASADRMVTGTRLVSIERRPRVPVVVAAVPFASRASTRPRHQTRLNSTSGVPSLLPEAVSGCLVTCLEGVGSSATALESLRARAPPRGLSPLAPPGLQHESSRIGRDSLGGEHGGRESIFLFGHDGWAVPST